jgi:hypothetical protein
MGDEASDAPPGSTSGGDEQGAISGAPVEAREERYRVPLLAWVMVGLVAVAGIAVAFLGGDRSVLMDDDFSDARTDWGESSDARGSLSIRDGAYHIAVVDEGTFESYATFRDVGSLRLDADAMMANGKGGLAVMCLSDFEALEGTGDVVDANADYYGFYILYDDGGYAIFQTDRDQPLAAKRDRALRSASGPQHLTARCAARSEGVDASLRLSVDGEDVVQALDGTGPERFVGVGLAVLSYGGPAEATFDNIKIVETT